MGFFDFVKKGIKVIKDVVVHPSPIVEGLGSLAGIVAHAIPGIGPVIDAAVPAINAIFSDDSSASRPAGQQPLPLPLQPLTPAQELERQLDRPLELNLKRAEAEIKRVFDSVNDLKHDLKEEFAARGEEIINHIDAILDYHKHQEYNIYLGHIKGGVNYFKDNEQTFRELTASSGASKFNTVFSSSDGSATLVSERDKLKDSIDSISVLMEDKTYTPSQEMLELYLYGLHWLLLFNKAAIVTRGLKARKHFANKEIGQYLDTLSKIRQDITYLRANAKRGTVLLQTLCEHLLTDRQDKIKVQISKDGSRIEIDDRWPKLSVGWRSMDYFSDQLKLDPLSTPYIAQVQEPGKTMVDTVTYDASKMKNFEDSTTVIVYRELTRRNLEAYLTPAQVVNDSLSDSIRHWNSRLPVTPLNPLPQGERPHIRAKPRPKPKTPSEDGLISELWGIEVSYAVSYLNQYGEGPESEWTPLVLVKKGVEEVGLELHPEAFEGDPTMGIEPVKTERGDLAISEKGIRRRIYVKWKPKGAENYMFDFVTAVGETEQSAVHRVVVKPGKEEEDEDDGRKDGKEGKGGKAVAGEGGKD